MSLREARTSLFAPSTFFPLAASRLEKVPPAVERGDHILNPGWHIDPPDYRDAAVLIPVIAREPEATVLLTVRTAHLAAHAGQIAFPGGKVEPADGSPAAAAIREAEEEVGLEPGLVDPLGYADPYLTRTGYRIYPVLGRVDPHLNLTLNRNEVDDAFEVPLAFLMTPENHRQGSRELLGRPRTFYEMPFEGRYIWGITAGIIRGLYERIFA